MPKPSKPKRKSIHRRIQILFAQIPDALEPIDIAVTRRGRKTHPVGKIQLQSDFRRSDKNAVDEIVFVELKIPVPVLAGQAGGTARYFHRSDQVQRLLGRYRITQEQPAVTKRQGVIAVVASEAVERLALAEQPDGDAVEDQAAAAARTVTGATLDNAGREKGAAPGAAQARFVEKGLLLLGEQLAARYQKRKNQQFEFHAY
jgi:hypothetical protein